MWVAAFFLLLAVVFLVRYVGKRFLPLLMPSGFRRTVAWGWLGGLAGALIAVLVDQPYPSVAGINLVAAFLGCFLFILFGGILPFIKIALGKT